MRTSVFSTYKDLPTLLSGQAPTIFEIVFVISWLLFAFVTIYTWKRKRLERANLLFCNPFATAEKEACVSLKYVFLSEH